MTSLPELVQRFGVTEPARAQLDTLLALLVEDPLAPTAIRSRQQAVDDHLADSLVALELDVVRQAHRFADIGSGAGLPGLPLAIAKPEAEFVLMDSVARKCAFIERAAGTCGLSNVTVLAARAEEAAGALGRGFEVVTARALAPLAVVAEYAAPLLECGGHLVAWRGRRDVEAEAEAERAARELGLAPGPVVTVQPYTQAESRHLHLMSKVMETPPRFPRRVGVAAKRPLGR